MVKVAKQEKVLQEIKEQLEKLSPAMKYWYYPNCNKYQTHWRLFKAGNYYYAMGVYHGLRGIDIFFNSDGEILYDVCDYKVVLDYVGILRRKSKYIQAKLEYIDTIICDYDNMQQFEIPEDYRY